jgi:hypothetical protein
MGPGGEEEVGRKQAIMTKFWLLPVPLIHNGTRIWIN